MIRSLLMILFTMLALSSSSLAQTPPQAPDPVLLQRMLSIAETDRGNLLNALTQAQAQAAIATENLMKAQARIKELEPKTAETPAPAADPPK